MTTTKIKSMTSAKMKGMNSFRIEKNRNYSGQPTVEFDTVDSGVDSIATKPLYKNLKCYMKMKKYFACTFWTCK